MADDTPAHVASHPLPHGRAADRHRRRDDGRASAGARHDDRQRRAAAHAGEPQRDAGHDQLGADELHRRLGDRAADQRLARRPGRAQAAAADLGRRCSPSLRCCARPRHRCREMVVFRALQGVGGAFIVPLAQATLFDINPRGKARPGDGAVRRRRDDRADPRSGARRLADRQLQLALGVPRQSAGRHSLHADHAALHAEDRDAPAQVRHVRVSFFWRLALAGLQLFLDRGEQQDWLSSWEIRIEAGPGNRRVVDVRRSHGDRQASRCSSARCSPTAISRPAWCSWP